MSSNCIRTIRECKNELSIEEIFVGCWGLTNVIFRLEDGTVPIMTNARNLFQSIGPSTRTQSLVGDPRRLRRWLREMENEMTKAPSISTASKMKSTELKRRLNEHSVSLFLFYFSFRR